MIKQANLLLMAFITANAMSGVLTNNLPAQQHAATLKDYVTDDVIAVGCVNLEKINLTAVLDQAQQLGFLDAGERVQAAMRAKEMDKQIGALKKAGISNIYVILRTSDLGEGAPSFLIPIAAGADTNAAARLLNQLTSNLVPLKIATGDQVVFVAGSDKQMKQLQDERPAAPRDLSAGWSAVGEGSLGVLICGDNDSRKVLKELMPALPAPFEMVTGKLMAEELNWIGMQLTLPPATGLKIEIEANAPAGAEAIAAAVKSVLDGLVTLPQVQEVLPENEREIIVAAMQPNVNGQHISMSLDQVTGDINRLTKVLAPAVIAARTAARRTQEANNLRQLALGLHNYESAFGKFPRADGKSDKYPAGLSWRVHILPFLEQKQLYQQFHLDEPWDSTHNLKLAKQMPAIYASPMAEAQAFNAEGKTTYQVPLAPEAIFQPNTDTAGFRDMNDGSSNTLMIVVTNPEEAAIWTQPDDWEVDLENPRMGLLSEQRKGASVSFADSSVHWLPSTIKPETLRALITRAGGEVVDGINN